MKVVIVAKTRMRGGACVGAITFDGQSVRLIDPKQEFTEHFNLEYEIGDIWEVDAEPPETIRPPHTENVVVRSKRRLRGVSLDRVVGYIEKVMPPVTGGTERLYDGLVQGAPGGPLYIAHHPELPNEGIPCGSTIFWRADHNLVRDEQGKRVRYRYSGPDGGCTLTFVGFQEPLSVIPAGALLRVSLAHWWRPEEHPEAELRCYVQLSGWFDTTGKSTVSQPMTVKLPTNAHQNQATATVVAMDPQAETSPLEGARRLLKSVFGYDDFLPLQSAIITNVLARRDTLAIMPTGGGKSLCYQLPALLFDGVTVVVSPLIALMQDQVDALGELGAPAAYLNSTVDYRTYVETATAVKAGSVKLVYMAPETLLRPETLLMLDRSNVCCLTIDEAHCISSWGHDFRPEYRQLLPVRRRYPKAVCLALTATATRRVRDDIGQILGFGAANEFVASFNRPNLFLSVQPRTDGLGQVVAFLESHRDQSGIIYCPTRKQVETLTEQLRRLGWSALPYHAGLDDRTRREHQRAFSRDETQIMVATIAFGMGINKSNIRFILHTALPENLENYYQQVGRAGRDGLPADCLLLWGASDLRTIRRFIDQGPETERPGKEARLHAMLRFAQASGCRRIPLLGYFGERATGACATCDNCLVSRSDTVVETVDVTAAAQLFIKCVHETGETFGAACIVDVLRGSRSKRTVLQWQHDRLPTYGQGCELPAEQWRILAQQLIAQSLLIQDEKHGGLLLSPRGQAVLDGASVRVPAALIPAMPIVAVNYERSLFEELRKLRSELAKAADVPAYVVFSDRTLQEMARALPRSPQALLKIPGVGERKLAQYGEQFLAVIGAYCAEHGVQAPVQTVTPPKQQSRSARPMKVGRLFAAGQTIEELQQLYGMKAQTIIRHLTEYQRDGNAVDGARLLPYTQVSENVRQQVLAKFDELGAQTLRPVYDAFDGEVSFDDLHLLRVYYLSLRSP